MKRSVSGSGTRLLDYEARDPVPDSEPRLWGLSRSPVVCDMATDKSRDTGPYLHVYYMFEKLFYQQKLVYTLRL